MVIGITGQIGSGKSTAAKFFKSHGAAVIDADRIGRQVVEGSRALLKQLVKSFGAEILTRLGNLSRKKLASLAFNDERSKRKLNRIVHPYLLKELNRQLAALSRQYEIVVIDAALLLDWNLDRLVDIVILVHASEKLRLGRLARRGISKADARARQKRQLTYAQYRARADFVVFNNDTPQKLHSKLRKILRRINAKGID
ncbi:MAG: dephospho-CoA kinase [Candidatus Zixiibacteriota bacterium]|nr:MAG: dephospho-CoA kinase [candidate division Zixibacteria bacterium]